jgi:hypothetical protein
LFAGIEPEFTGVYFQLVWRRGTGDAVLRRYAAEAYRLETEHSAEGRYPEWVLQNLDQDWLTELPTPAEANAYIANTHYAKNLLSRIGSTEGAALEELAEHIMVCMPGSRTSERRRSPSTDYDIVRPMEGFDVDFRSEPGRYLCANARIWNKAAEFTTMAKFYRVLDPVKSKFGILFAKEGIAGAGDARYAESEQLKVFQDRERSLLSLTSKL